MSWSAHYKGAFEDAKENLAEQFLAAKRATANLPEEQKSVELVEQLVNHHLDSHVNFYNAVEVNAYGSATCDWNVTPPKVLDVSVGVSVTPMNDPNVEFQWPPSSRAA